MTGVEEPPSAWAWENLNRDEARGYERSEAQKDYDLLRDTIIQAFNPLDEDVAEPALMTDTLDRLWRFVVHQPCTCPLGEGLIGAEPCDRCAVLGRVANVVVER